MKFSLTTADTSQFVVGILMLVGAVVLPAFGVLTWALVFRKSRRRRKRREPRGTNPAFAPTGGLPPIRRREGVTDQPKS
jgi:hypothetical protein